ncbi:glyoxalase [Paenibacillus selenitireducens]|uniref:Glyoxalase n=1 Tax=Paenibacillus selenitireducens TaxID=1324314 RepID=A0A1T2X1C5_9BACL|nr:DinB family protein [Paenibacillus selenitireducens]OPA73681.1 glyoxalase [Paenibacillus selenitireducens]
MALFREDIEIVNRYKDASTYLLEAINNLSEESLNLAREPGKWTIREIVHHIVECDLNYFQINRYALANTGAYFVFNEFDSHLWLKNMDHSNRSVQVEVKLFELLRNYIAYLCEILPDSLDRILVHQNGKATVRDALKHDIEHSYHHIKQILETRRIHKV